MLLRSRFGLARFVWNFDRKHNSRVVASSMMHCLNIPTLTGYVRRHWTTMEIDPKPIMAAARRYSTLWYAGILIPQETTEALVKILRKGTEHILTGYASPTFASSIVHLAGSIQQSIECYPNRYDTELNKRLRSAAAFAVDAGIIAFPFLYEDTNAVDLTSFMMGFIKAKRRERAIWASFEHWIRTYTGWSPIRKHFLTFPALVWFVTVKAQVKVPALLNLAVVLTTRWITNIPIDHFCLLAEALAAAGRRDAVFWESVVSRVADGAMHARGDIVCSFWASFAASGYTNSVVYVSLIREYTHRLRVEIPIGDSAELYSRNNISFRHRKMHKRPMVARSISYKGFFKIAEAVCTAPLWSLGVTLGSQDAESFWHTFRKDIGVFLERLDANALSMVLLAFARHGIKYDVALRLGVETVNRSALFGPPLVDRGEDVRLRVGMARYTHVDNLPVSTLVRLSFSFALVNYWVSDVFHAIADMRKILSMTVTDVILAGYAVALLSRAIVTGKISSSTDLEKNLESSDAAVRGARKLQSYASARLCWTGDSPALLAGVAKAVQMYNDILPEDLTAYAATAIATMDNPDRNALIAISVKLADFVSSIQWRHLALFCQAFGDAEVFHVPFLRAIAQRFSADLSSGVLREDGELPSLAANAAGHVPKAAQAVHHLTKQNIASVSQYVEKGHGEIASKSLQVAKRVVAARLRDGDSLSDILHVRCDPEEFLRLESIPLDDSFDLSSDTMEAVGVEQVRWLQRNTDRDREVAASIGKSCDLPADECVDGKVAWATLPITEHISSITMQSDAETSTFEEIPIHAGKSRKFDPFSHVDLTSEESPPQPSKERINQIKTPGMQYMDLDEDADWSASKNKTSEDFELDSLLNDEGMDDARQDVCPKSPRRGRRKSVPSRRRSREPSVESDDM